MPHGQSRFRANILERERDELRRFAEIGEPEGMGKGGRPRELNHLSFDEGVFVVGRNVAQLAAWPHPSHSIEASRGWLNVPANAMQG